MEPALEWSLGPVFRHYRDIILSIICNTLIITCLQKARIIVHRERLFTDYSYIVQSIGSTIKDMIMVQVLAPQIMKKFSAILSLILSMVVLSGCTSEYSKIRRELIEFEKTEVEIPSDMLVVSGGKVHPFHGAKTLAKTFVVYYPSVDCSDCMASELSNLIPIYSLMQERGIFFKCIMSPADGLIDDLLLKLSDIKYPYDIYLDTSNAFSSLNHSLPSDPRFHLFCTDSRGKPFFVGNPCLNQKSYNLFIKTLKNNLK